MSQKVTVSITLFGLLSSVLTFTPLTKEEQIRRMNKINEDVEPFRRNLTECARQVRASAEDVDNFLKRIPQSSFQGKCLVACILKRNSIIRHNKIMKENLLEVNLAVYSEDSEVMSRLKKALDECEQVVADIFEICEFSSLFNDCMHMKMEHILDKVTMERRMEALGQMSPGDNEYWVEPDDDENLQLLKDEL